MQTDLNRTSDQMHGTGARMTLSLVGCGGVGTKGTLKVQAAMPSHPAIGYRFVDTTQPDAIPTAAFTELRPDQLPDDPDPEQRSLIVDHGMTVPDYRRWKAKTGKDGIGQIPFLSSVAAAMQIDNMAAGLEGDHRAQAAAVNGVPQILTVTCASLIGGTGASSARIVGLAARLIDGLAPKSWWFHVAISSRLLSPNMRTRRTRALEHRQLIELSALMRPGACLRLPNRRLPVSNPGPDFLIMLDSSAEHPRTFDESIDELAAILWNLVTA